MSLEETLSKIMKAAGVESDKPYTSKEIRTLIKENCSKEEICGGLGVSAPQVSAVQAHITMGTYSRLKERVRDLTDKEVKDIYTDLKQVVSGKITTDDVASKYKITKIRVMGYLAAYTRKLNEK